MSDLKQSHAFRELNQHFQSLADFSLIDAFAADPGRAQKLSLDNLGILADFSKELITEETLSLLINLAEARGLRHRIDALKQGERLNNTENRQVLHYLLRAKRDDVPKHLDREYADVCQVQHKMQRIADSILGNQQLSATGRPFTDVVHIGIGGSYLGPAMLYESLKPFQQTAIRCHFVANICPNEIGSLLPNLDPETTLFIVASKTFTTLETLCNADTAKNWLVDHLGESAVASHFYAVTASIDKAVQYGIKEDHILTFRDWVGGRYSTFSAIGLVLAIGFGYDTFARILAGARAMDQHFFQEPCHTNMPVIMALIGIWYINFYNRDTLCIAPYDFRLRSFRAYLQQLEMESNGKSVDREGKPLNYATCPVLFGEPGTNCQHSYFQLLHQSTEFIPVNFITCLDQPYAQKDHFDWLQANCIAQSQALMTGKARDQSTLGDHKHMQGNRPSTTLLLDALTPERMGSLIALYEHKVFVQGVIWDINSFDQWGVELGKRISQAVHRSMTDTSALTDMDPSSQQLIKRVIASAP